MKTIFMFTKSHAKKVAAQNNKATPPLSCSVDIKNSASIYPVDDSNARGQIVDLVADLRIFAIICVFFSGAYTEHPQTFEQKEMYRSMQLSCQR